MGVGVVYFRFSSAAITGLHRPRLENVVKLDFLVYLCAHHSEFFSSATGAVFSLKRCCKKLGRTALGSKLLATPEETGYVSSSGASVKRSSRPRILAQPGLDVNNIVR